MNVKEKDTVTREERSLLETLDKIVRSEKVHAQILPILERVRNELAWKPNTLMACEPIAFETFGALPPAIRSGWVFILRTGTDTGAERHPNSHQRMMSFEATGDLQTDLKSAESDVQTESEIVWQSNVLVSDPDEPLERRWISIPQNVWHRPVMPQGADWVVVSFHTVPAAELIEERPGAKQMRYVARSKSAERTSSSGG